MLDRTKMITALTEEAEGNHDQIFVLRRDLNKLSLPDLAKRYEETTRLNAYDGTPLQQEVESSERPTSEEIDALCET